MTKQITVIVVTWNNSRILDALTDTLKVLASSCEIIISDNGSTDGTPDRLEESFPGAIVLRNPRNGGFGYGNNRALECCRTPFVLLLNPDARINLSSLGMLHAALSLHTETAAVQPLIRLWDWKYITLSAGTAMTYFGEGYDLRFMHYQKNAGDVPLQIPGVTAAVALYRLAALREVKGFDERFFMYFEDTDLSNRIQAKGWKFLLIPQSEAFHMQGASSSRNSAEKWELASSVLLTRKYLCGNDEKLPRYWKKRERRIRLSAIKRWNRWFWRIRCIRNAMDIPVERITLEKDVLSYITAFRPSLMPQPRSESYDNAYLDTSELIKAGPGWSIPEELITGKCGCLEVPEAAGKLGLRMLSHRNAGTVSIQLEDTAGYRYFIEEGGMLELSIYIPERCRRIYIIPDNPEHNVKITDFRYEK